MAQLTQEELQQVRDLQSKYNQTLFEIGIAEAQRLTLLEQIEKRESDKKVLLADLLIIEKKETELNKEFQNKYGTSNINPETGEITPIQ